MSPDTLWYARVFGVEKLAISLPEASIIVASILTFISPYELPISVELSLFKRTHIVAAIRVGEFAFSMEEIVLELSIKIAVVIG